MTVADLPIAVRGSDLNMPMLSSRNCGFCATGSHDRCPGGTRSGVKGVRICPCEETERCGQKRCLKCNNRRPEEISDSWLCIAGSECDSRVRARLEADPQHQQVVEAKRRGKMAETAEKTAKKEKVVKEGKCLVTGKPTKGGLFAPGQDAKYVSLRVAEHVEAKFTKKSKDEIVKRMKADGVSEKLVAKFEKSARLAQERAEKAKAAADEKAAAKAKDKATADA